MCRFHAREAIAYARERLPVATTLFVGGLLGTASLVGGGALTPWEIARRFALTLGLFVELRIWDDLADAPRDRQEHPTRVMVRAASHGTFHWLLGVLLLLDGALVVCGVRPGSGAAAFVTLHALGALWYSARQAVHDGALRAQCLLLKYPLIGGVAAAVVPREVTPDFLVAITTTYAAFVVYEHGHDPKVSAEPYARALLSATSALAALGAACIAVRASGVTAVGIAGAIALSIAAVVVMVIVRTRASAELGRLPLAFFALALLQCLAMLLWI